MCGGYWERELRRLRKLLELVEVLRGKRETGDCVVWFRRGTSPSSAGGGGGGAMQDSAKMTAMRGRDEQRWLLHGGSRDADTNDDVSSSSESRASRRRCASMSCVSAAGCGGLWRRRKAGGGAGGGRSVLSLLGLAAVVFYEVSGGPFGSEDAVAAGGPLLALAGFIVMPMVWSVPEAFVVAELATAMPENAGYAAWVSEAFGSFWGFQEGYWSWVSGVTDNAVYPLLFLLYLCGDCDDDALGEYEDIVSSLLRRPMFRWIFLVLTILMLTFINHRGIHIVGRTSVALAGFTLLPFIILVMLGIPKVREKDGDERVSSSAAAHTQYSPPGDDTFSISTILSERIALNENTKPTKDFYSEGVTIPAPFLRMLAPICRHGEPQHNGGFFSLRVKPDDTHTHLRSSTSLSVYVYYMLSSHLLLA